MNDKSAFYIQLVGAGFVGWLAGGASYTMFQAFAWIVSWIVICTIIRILGDT